MEDKSVEGQVVGRKTNQEAMPVNKMSNWEVAVKIRKEHVDRRG